MTARTLSGAMDAALWGLMHTAADIDHQPAMKPVQARILLAVAALEAIRLGVQHLEGIAPADAPATPAPVVNLAAFRARATMPEAPL